MAKKLTPKEKKIIKIYLHNYKERQNHGMLAREREVPLREAFDLRESGVDWDYDKRTITRNGELIAKIKYPVSSRKVNLCYMMLEPKIVDVVE